MIGECSEGMRRGLRSIIGDMRPWVKKHPVVVCALSLVLIFVGWLALLVAWGSPAEEAAVQALMGVGIGSLVAFFIAGSRRKTERKLEAHCQILAYIRYPNSPPGSLSGIWNQGVLTPSVGKLEFQPALYDSLVPSGTVTVFNVLHVSPKVRKLRGRDSRYLGVVGFQAISATTDQDVIDIAASPASLQKLIERLASRSEPTESK